MRTGSLLVLMLFIILTAAQGQRSYKESSVFATGNWYQLAVKEAGIYKVDVAMLNKLGVNTNNLSSASIRLFGNGGAMLPEACKGLKNDDLLENAILVNDGGDGIFNNNDYFLFFAPGPDIWVKDSVNQRFRHVKNLYSTESFYFISFGAGGKRISTQPVSPAPNTNVISFNERWFHELDTINLLQSGKDWYGEELSALPGRSQAFNPPLTGINTPAATLVSSCAARSVNGTSRFTATINGNPVLQQDIAAVGGTNLDPFAKSSLQAASFNAANTNLLTYTFSPGGANAQGWIDWLEMFYRRNLSVNDHEQLMFRDWTSVGNGKIAQFILQNFSGQVWDITNIAEPVIMKTTVSGNNLSFTDSAAWLHEYICFSDQFLTPRAAGKIANQNLHSSGSADLLIVSSPTLMQQAQTIARYHQQNDNLKTAVVTTSQVFNEFASGTSDPVAIRDFVKMYYDRAATDTSLRPKYLLLLGDASYDYKNRVSNNTNFVPGYESNSSLDPLSTYTSDDFFGLLDDSDDINSNTASNLLDIGIGRIPAQTPEQAKAFVDKLINYNSPQSLGAWRNQQTFVADDQDLNLHLNDAENITAAAGAANSLFVQNKMYLDAYAQNKTPLGSSYPQLNQAISNRMGDGTLIFNYNGHGSSSRLAEETILDKNTVDSWTNTNRLPLMITATCDFAPFDNPAINSLGEYMLLRPNTGAIALMTTTRLVFAYSNRVMNRNYLQAALQPRADGGYPSLGEAVMRAKNDTYQTQNDIANNRKFTLLGDPALTLAFPPYRVQTSTINGKAVQALPDTLKPLGKYRIGGYISDVQGNVLNSFNGTVYLTVYDKQQTATTRANDPDSYPQNFIVPGAVIFKGKATVINGQFNVSFVVPKDIQSPIGPGRINYYAENGKTDANGNFNGFVAGGQQQPNMDNTGPDIKGFITDENFVNGNPVPSNPLLIIKLSDSSGINIAGEATGHPITAIVDGDASQTFVLNQFFESATDSYQQGSIRYQLPEMEEGVHTLVIKAWDVNNNSNTASISFRVLRKDALGINMLMNYPNPFAGHTSFRFEHNRPNTDVKVEIGIFDLGGRQVKSLVSTINTPGSRSSDIDWDGMGNHGEMLVPGVYIYRVQVSSGTDGQTAVKTGKLIRQ